MLTEPRPSRAQALAAAVERSIAERGLRPGDRITTLDELREQTGLGRQAIGEATRLLAERGTIEVRPGRGGGLFVAEVTPMVRLRNTLLAVPEGSATVTDAIALRDALEELLDTDAARHRSDADVRDLRALLAVMRQNTARIDAFIQANWALHKRIAQITPNRMASAVYLGALQCISELPARVASSEEADQAYLERRLEVHVELVDAIISGDQLRTVAAVRAHRGSDIPEEAATSPSSIPIPGEGSSAGRSSVPRSAAG